MEILQTAWSFKLSLLPVLSAFFVFEMLTLLRRAFKVAYTPIYFLLFPLGHSDALYAQYFNEDDFFIGESMSEGEKRLLRRKIVSRSIFSTLFSVVLNPFICGAFCAYFLTNSQYVEFLFFLLFYKIFTLSVSLYRTRYISFVEKSGSWLWLFLIYIGYFIVIFVIVNESYVWTQENLIGKPLLDSLQLILSFLVIDLGVYIGLVALVTWAISVLWTDPALIPESSIHDFEGEATGSAISSEE